MSSLPYHSELFAALLTVLQLIGPAHPSPLRPICDLRVLDRFTMEARDTESAVRSCKAGCGVSGSFVVPRTNVDMNVWPTKDVLQHAAEVHSGLIALGRALGSVREMVSKPDLRNLIDGNWSNIQSLGQVLRSLHMQELVLSPSPEFQTSRVASLSELLRTQTNFLRGKVRLLLNTAPACQQNGS
ncbi:erythropoietin b [Aplochiton taeniatus]